MGVDGRGAKIPNECFMKGVYSGFLKWVIYSDQESEEGKKAVKQNTTEMQGMPVKNSWGQQANPDFVGTAIGTSMILNFSKPLI